MERLVQSVFRDHFQTDVKHIGKSHDGGVDLLMLLGENPYILQVKRRKSPGKTEGVSCIRELLGATLLNGGKNSIFVTTADHFSSAAKNAAQNAVTKSIVNSFDLINGPDFISMLNQHPLPKAKRWEPYLKGR